MPNNEDRNFDRGTPLSELRTDPRDHTKPPTIPVLIPRNSVRRVVDAVRARRAVWFLLQLTDGQLTIASPVRIGEGGMLAWQLVADSDWPELDVDPTCGMPIQYETVECPICEARMDVTFSCTKSLDEVYTTCPKCGYRIENLRNNLVHDDDDDDDGGTIG